MKEDYTFYNCYCYDKDPIDFKAYVLNQLRDLGYFNWLRDEPRWIKDEKNFLNSTERIPYIEKEIKRDQDRVKKAKKLLKQLKELDDRYRANWRVYDNAQPGAEYIIPGTKPAQTLDQQITAACKYLTYGRKRLPELDGRPDDALAIRTEMQKRIDFLTEVGHRFSRGVLISLQSLGFRTP